MILVGLALAGGGPEASGLAIGGLGSTEEVPHIAGGELTLGWRFSQLALEAAGDGGARVGNAPWATLVPRARVYLSDPSQPVFSIFGGAGADMLPDTQLVGQAGAAIDLGAHSAVRARIQAMMMVREDLASHIVFGVGAKLGRATHPEPVIVPEPVVVAEPLEERPIVLGEPGMVWVPGPVCQWLPVQKAPKVMALRGLVIERPTSITARSLFGKRPAPADRMPMTGKLVVVASQAEVITIDGNPVSVKDGLIITTPDALRAEVEVIGGGRTLKVPVAVVADNAVWLPIEPPETMRFSFGQGQTRLDAATQEALSAVAAQSGNWSYELHGSFSPEGSRQGNLALANARAKGVRDALVEYGIPEDRIRMGEPQPPEEGLDADAQRSAIVIPVEGL